MTDTLLSPNGVESYTVRTIVVPGLGVVAPVGSLTPGEVQALRDDVASVMNLDLGDLANVTEEGSLAGMVVTAQGDGTWAPQAPQTGVARVRSALGTEVNDAHHFYFRNGITTLSNNPENTGIVTIEPVFGGSGVAITVARSDHRHPPTLKGRFLFDKAAAVLGGGISTLIDETVTGLVSTVIYDVTITGTLEAVNTNQSGRLLLFTKIGTATEQSKSRGFSGGVWTEVTASGTRMGVTGVTSLRLQFWAEYQSGDPTGLYTGELMYDIAPRGGQQ